MKTAALRMLIFIPYALAVWATAYQGLKGDDALGLISILLLLGGAAVIVYLKFFQRTITLGLFSPAVVLVLGLIGVALGTISSGETEVGVIAGLIVAVGAAATIAIIAQRRKRRIKTLFISYRRADSGEITPLIQRRLAERFGTENIFFDIDSIELGSQFREVIADAVNHSDALVAVIGKEWIGMQEKEGTRRIDEAHDLVRIEIEAALKNPRVQVIPLAVNGADIPEAEQLPPSIKDLAWRNGGVVRPQPDFDEDLSRLIRGIEKGAITPWSRTERVALSWSWILAMIAVLLTPISWLLIEEIWGYQTDITSAALSPDSTIVATAHGSGPSAKSRLRLWNTSNGNLLQTVHLDKGPVWTMRFSPEGSYLAFGDHEGMLTVLATLDWKVRFQFQQHSGMLQEIAWAHNGDRLATGDRYGALRVWDIASGELQYTARPHTKQIEKLSWSPNDRFIATASSDNTAAISDSRSGEVLYRLEGHASSLTGVAWAPDGDFLSTASVGQPFLRIWRMTDLSSPIPPIGHQSKVERIAWSPTSPLLASSSNDNTVRIWEETGALKHVFEMRGYGSLNLIWSNDGSLLAATDNESVWLWNIKTGELLNRFIAHPDDYDIQLLGWSSDNRSLITHGSSDDTIKVWDLSAKAPITQMRANVLSSLFEFDKR